ncbi:hypothetical protein IQ276_032490 [Desmonostoc muscorum LEGE 12446]|uniref:Uncharacterized protein n=1 Tax=Desmonostoc muscorum LEGE 12446 TaxID=1828758 RepID=A0A8J7ACC6_DESMC|nr:hypothetical protein [Desmonostoc muscorum]MCF2151062.1 hypothetical protein [Desmonostoc muscorum LEGE 12446]
MWLSTRVIRFFDDYEYREYTNDLGLPARYEIRSIDSWCNPHLSYSRNFRLDSLEQVWELLDWLPSPVSSHQYYLLFASANKHKIPENHPRLKLLGYDLLDVEGKSSLWNYRPWRGILKPLVQKVNRYGLLTWSDAVTAQAILPQAWHNHPRSVVKICTLFEVLPLRDFQKIKSPINSNNNY